jgi:hypothetical protein
MFHPGAICAVRSREDISPYLGHPTRDNTNHFPRTGKDAGKTFNDIWNQKVIRARRVLVACFTATPLSQLRHFVSVYCRDYRFEAYGFIFERETLLMKGAGLAHACLLFARGLRRGRSGFHALPLLRAGRSVPGRSL